MRRGVESADCGRERGVEGAQQRWCSCIVEWLQSECMGVELLGCGTEIKRVNEIVEYSGGAGA